MPLVMEMYAGSREIINSTEKYDPAFEIRGKPGKQRAGKASRTRYSIDDDINKLFEVLDIGSSCEDFYRQERNVRSTSHKSAMKRPMRVSPSHASGAGITESVSLKQALRGMCISQASEIAAVKKQRLKPHGSPGVADVRAIKRLYKAVVTDACESSRLYDEDGGNLAEISSMNERNSLNAAEKGLETRRESADKAPERTKVSSVPFVDVLVREKIPTLDGVPISYEGQETAREKNKRSEGELRSVSSSSNVENKMIKPSSRLFGLSKQGLRGPNLTKKRNATRTNPNTDNQFVDVGNGDSYVDVGKVSPKLSGYVSSVMGSTSVDSNSYEHDPNLCISGKMNSVVETADEGLTSMENGEISRSTKSSIGEYSSTTSYSIESYLNTSSRSGRRPHMSKDLRWEAIQSVQQQDGSLALRHFKMLTKLGGGDIGNVYLSELVGTSCLFAVKVMDHDLLASRKTILRAQSEKEILEILDHPFLPTLYAHFTTKKFSCLIMEHCPGGDLHGLRQKQPAKSFREQSARFYAAEVLLALEYLHMLGVVYRDLKPENILIREDGHIMLSDFDLSLRCNVNPVLVKSSSPLTMPRKSMPGPFSDSGCIDPFCLNPSWRLSCFAPRFLSAAAKTRKLKSELASQIIPLPQLVVEPTGARSNSFVGTHEYLAPEIIKAEGHGSAVDWWTFGILLFELLYGETPFKGSSDEDTISNVISQHLKFPDYPLVSPHARDLISRLLNKEPEKRLGSEKGAAEIKQHPFFDGLNWALVRSLKPPELPKFDLGSIVPDRTQIKSPTELECGEDKLEFEMF